MNKLKITPALRSVLAFTVTFVSLYGFSQANNNPCNNAPFLTVNTTCVNTLATIGASDNYSQNANNFGQPTCGNQSNEADVWYAFTAPASGNVTVSTSDGTITDAVMEIYSADCSGAYTSLGCSDDVNNSMPELTLTGLTTGTTYYIRLWEYNGGTGNFNICVQETTTTPCTTGGLNGTCGTSDPFCTGNVYTYCNTTNVTDAFASGVACNNVAADGTSYSDNVSTSPNPSFYYLEVGTGGDLAIAISQENTTGTGIDVDFIMWGPFTSTTTACTSVNGDPTSNLVDCSYSGSDTEEANILSSTAGEVYMLMLTNYQNETGTITFTQSGGSGATDCSIVPLPAELVQFDVHQTVKDNRTVAQLTWETATESDNAYFAVEHSTDGTNFVEIGKVHAAGNSTQRTNYEFAHVDFDKEKTNYYRLRQVDLNGAFGYSKVISFRQTTVLDEVLIYPNPAKNIIRISLAEASTTPLTLRFVDTYGRTLKHIQTTSNNQTSIDVSDLENGLYHLIISSQKVDVRKRIEIKR